MMVFKRKQVVILSLVLMIVVAGYLQYSSKKSSISVSGKENGRLGEAVYVDNKDVKDTAKTDNKDSKDNKTSNATPASKQANDFFAQAKLEKEISRGKDTDALKAITDDKTAAKDAKTKAYDQMMKIVDNSQKEMRIETLLREKGFSDVVALFGDDGSMDIVVKTPNLTSAQTAQIADIASRQANIQLARLHVRNIY